MAEQPAESANFTLRLLHHRRMPSKPDPIAAHSAVMRDIGLALVAADKLRQQVAHLEVAMLRLLRSLERRS